jgi:hypothetical protein
MKFFTFSQGGQVDIPMRLPMWFLLALPGVLLLLTQSSAAVETPDESPHWNKSACLTCHNNPLPIDDTDLKLDNYSDLCTDCHSETTASACPHPTDLPIQDLGQLTLPDSYHLALADDRIVCTSCHSMQLQCAGGRREQYQNPAFLRNGPFRHPGEACFECHDSDSYEKLNPHETVADGQTQTCLLCHDIVPVPGGNSGPGLRLAGNLQCTGCHVVTPHPLSMAPGANADTWTHLVVPTPEILSRMQAARNRTGITLPLDPYDGAVNCATCHNAHAADEPLYPLSSESGTQNKLRMVDLCEACHDK